MEFEKDINALKGALYSLDRDAAADILIGRKDRLSDLTVTEKIVTPALERIGEDWERGKSSLSQIYMAGRIVEELLDKILTINEGERRVQPRIALGVLEDYHLLGKRLVGSVLRTAGYEVFDFGHGVSVDAMTQRTVEEDIDILLVSVLMLRSALRVENLVSEINKSDKKTKVVVGGAPFRFDEQLWKDVGASAMGYDASQAVNIIERMR